LIYWLAEYQYAKYRKFTVVFDIKLNRLTPI